MSKKYRWGCDGEERTVRKGVNLRILARLSIYATETGKGILTINIHRARATDALSAGTAEGERGVNFVLNFDERVKNLWRGKREDSSNIRIIDT